MPKTYVTILGKSVKAVAKMRGGGSALPGLVVEKIDPNFIKHTLGQLPHGVVVISGTNGKTTTTKMVVELLEGQGLKVFTNRTGSNFTRGVAAALLGETSLTGKLKADIAVLELDEAHAVNFVRTIHPRFSLILNVMRDQLDRFGEIDATQKMLRQIAINTTDTVVLNREDRRVAEIQKSLTSQKVKFFGLDKLLINQFPTDDTLRGGTTTTTNVNADVVLNRLSVDKAEFIIDSKAQRTNLKLNGIYNVFNAAAALTLVRAIVGEKVDNPKLLKDLSNVTPAFGRGETLLVKGQPLELVLVKNPSGFRLGLKSFDPRNYATMIAINDNYADGRDMSWLWDVDFESLHEKGVSQVSGIRAYDMGLRLKYDEVKIENIDSSITRALKKFIDNNKDKPKRIYCTYTAMLDIRNKLSKITKVEKIS